MMKAGKTDIEIGTKVKIIDSSSSFLIGIKGKIENPFTSR